MSSTSATIYPASLFTDQDIYLFKQGRHFYLYNKFGAHPMTKDGAQGTCFALWAPNAKSVSVMGNFNGWNKSSHPLFVRWDHSGIWEGFVPGIHSGELYKFYIDSSASDYKTDKIDPFAFYFEEAPRTGCFVHDLSYDWSDRKWMVSRHRWNSLSAPISIYEVHPGSWRRVMEDNNRSFTYRELANYLVDYVKQMGFTHIELMPVMEHPFYGSWGYQSLGYFAPTSRYGNPQDLMFLIDRCHQNGIGVILDWVPSHFPSDEHGLAYFDGTKLYEHEDPQKGFHPDWNCYIFNNGRYEVKEFLISSALFWFDKYHIDGLRVDAVASMLYLDYSRKDGEWMPNIYGGRENLESIDFLKTLNETIYQYYPDVMMIAEESTSWTKVSRPTYDGGLGFGFKWNMGWMHDTLQYISKDPVHRKYHQNDLTFSMIYGFTENFILSLSHDEVVHGKSSLLGKMPGNDWQRFANLRLLYGYMFAHPGKKLLFMGGEFAQWDEWNHEKSLDWHLLPHDRHKGVWNLVKDLNRLIRQEPALHQKDCVSNGFQWVDISDHDNCIISFLRKSDRPEDTVVVVCNFTPTTHDSYRIGVPRPGFWKELLNTDAHEYGGSGQGNAGGRRADLVSYHGFSQSLDLRIPPLGILVLKPTS